MLVTKAIGNNPTVPSKTLKSTLDYSVNTDAENTPSIYEGLVSKYFFFWSKLNDSFDVGGKILHFLFTKVFV